MMNQVKDEARREQDTREVREEQNERSTHDGDFRHYPKSSAKRRPPIQLGGANRSEAIDMPTAIKCARMLFGTQTTEYVPNSF